MASDWIEWNGGECPVPPDTLVEVRLRQRNGETVHTCSAWVCRWSHGKTKPWPLDITHYRVLQPAPKPEPAPEYGKTVAGGGTLTLRKGVWGVRRDGDLVGPFSRNQGGWDFLYPWAASGATYTGDGLFEFRGKARDLDIVEIIPPSQQVDAPAPAAEPAPTAPPAPPAPAETISAPSHYTWHPSGIECRTIVQAFPYNVGTAIAYLWRHAHKGTPIQDLKKAIRHIEFEIERIEGGASDRISDPSNTSGVLT